MVLSKWIVLMTFLITLFMSFAKRRDDVLRMEKTGEAPRKNTIQLLYLLKDDVLNTVLHLLHSSFRSHLTLADDSISLIE